MVNVGTLDFMHICSPTKAGMSSEKNNTFFTKLTDDTYYLLWICVRILF